MQNLYLYSWAVLPSIILVSIFYFTDIFKEPKKQVIVTFLLGFAFSLFLMPLIYIFEIVINPINFDFNSYDISFHFLRAAFLEETFKLLVLVLYCSRIKAFNEPIDAIVYGVAVSLGFSANENIDYIMSGQYSDNIHLIRIMPTIMHATTAIIMGFFIGNFYKLKIPSFFLIFLALFIPCILHGTYNSLAVFGEYGYFILLLIIMILIIVSSLIAIRRVQKSKIMEPEWLTLHSNSYIVGTIIINFVSISVICTLIINLILR